MTTTSTRSVSRVRVAALSKSYGAVQALQSADFDLAAGEVMGLVGENGAGKSTFVKILCGFTRRDSGSIEVDGAAVDIASPKRAEQAGIAVVQQELSVVGSLSVAENVFLGRPHSARVFTRRSLVARAIPFLEMVGLEHLDPRREASTLPVAERQLVEIARVVSGDAKVILLDEPTASLSDDDIARVKAVVRRLGREGRSVVYITHRLGEVFDLAARVTVFRDGRSLPAVNTADTTPDELIKSMLGRSLTRMFPPPAARLGASVLDVTALATGGLAEPASATVRRGEIFGFAGQLGSGAAEFLRGLSGTQPATADRITVDGRTVTIRNPREALHAGIAYCSGDRKLDGFFRGRTVADNFTAPALTAVSPSGVLRRSLERRLAGRLAGLVDFDIGRLRHRVETLSGGNQQKVVLGKWVGADPRVLLIDEPTRGVDVGARAEIYRHLRRLTDDGLTIVFASSDMQEVHGLADTVTTWYRGRKVATYESASVSYEQLIRDITRPEEGLA